jgi:hypothetical protein
MMCLMALASHAGHGTDCRSKNLRLTHYTDSGPYFEPVRRVHTDHCGGTSPQILHKGGVFDPTQRPDCLQTFPYKN